MTINSIASKRFIQITTLSVLSLLVVFVCDAFAQSGVSTDTVGKIVDAFVSKSNAWSSSLQNYALHLFGICATLTIAMFGVKAVVNRHNLNEVMGQFIMTLLFCGFILAVIHNYQEWSGDIVTGLKNIAGELGPSDVKVDQPLKVGYDMATMILKKVTFLSTVADAGKSLGFIIAALVIMIAFSLMTAQVVLIKCEAALVMNACMILLGLGGATIFKEYAINVMRYVLSVAFKLFVMQLVLGLGLEFMQGMSVADATFEDIIIVIGVSVVLFALVKSLPDAISGIINGSHVTSGSALSQAAGAVAAGVGGAVGGVVGGAVASHAAGMAVKKAAQTSGASGTSGFGKVGQFMSTLSGSHMDSRREAGKQGHFERMSDNAGKRLQEMKMRNINADGGGGSGASNSPSTGSGGGDSTGGDENE